MRGLPTILPTTKQVVGNGHLQTDLDGKNKKALYLQANNRASKTFLDGQKNYSMFWICSQNSIGNAL